MCSILVLLIKSILNLVECTYFFNLDYTPITYRIGIPTLKITNYRLIGSRIGTIFFNMQGIEYSGIGPDQVLAYSLDNKPRWLKSCETWIVVKNYCNLKEKVKSSVKYFVTLLILVETLFILISQSKNNIGK